MSSDFLLVIPAFEEHARLPPFLKELAKELGSASFSTAIRVVNDGSSMSSRQELERRQADLETPGSVQILPLLNQPTRRGKGCAIRTGWNAGPPARWLAFVDADGAIPAGEVRRILEQVVKEQAGGICMGIRRLDADRRVERVWYRKGMSRVFTVIVRAVFGGSFHDPQCGFKIISSSEWERVKERSVEDGFCFDVELLLLVKGNRSPIAELPIDWEEKSGSHVSPVRDGCGTLLGLCALGLRKLMGDL